MKKSVFIFWALAIVLGMGASTASAQNRGMYLSGNVGVLWVEDSDVTWYDGFRDEAQYDTGVGVVGAFGYGFGSGFRTEFEIGFRFNNVDRQYPDGIGGEIYSTSVMGNVFFDFLPGYRVSPFLGAGIGFANVEVNLDYWDEENDTVFAYQCMAGVSIAVAHNFSIDLQYRYFATEDPDFDIFEGEYQTHSLMAGFRLSF